MTQRSKILILSIPEGHLSLAKAAQAHLQAANIAHHLEVLPEPALWFYKPFYRHTPHHFKLVFDTLNTPVLQPPARGWLRLRSRKIKKLINQYNPTAIINTSFGFSAALNALQPQFGFKIFNIVPNPRTFFTQDIALPPSHNLVFDQTQANLFAKIEPTSQNIVSGWFTQPQYFISQPKELYKKHLGLDPDKITLCFTTGSEGAKAAVSILPNLLNTFDALQPSSYPQILILAGNNQKLFAQFNSLASTFKQFTIRVVGFQPDLSPYFAASDMVIGKAGPNTIFESVACQTPFLATTHIGGLEAGNLEIIRELQLGEVATDAQLAIQKINAVINNPGILSNFMPHLVACNTHNLQAGSKLLQLLQLESEELVEPSH